MAIPLSRKEFADDEARGTDFVRVYCSEGTALRSACVDCLRQRFAERCRSLVDDADRELGVSVTTRARVQDFLDATASHDTVTLVAHARGPEITETDIVDVEGVRAAAFAMMEQIGDSEALPSSVEDLAKYLDWALETMT